MRARAAAPRVLLLLVGVLGVGGCSALLDWNDFTGGVGDGGTDGATTDASVDATGGDGGGTDASADAPPMSCGTAMQCTPSAPAGWTGPVELYVGSAGQGAPPSCGAGFDATPAFDGNGDLVAEPATCSACGCGAVSGETCQGPVMSFFYDTSCQMPAGVQTVTSDCQTTPPLAQSVTVAAPLAAGGTCAGTGGMATTTPPSWGQVARACSASSPSSVGCPGDQVCAASPASPFSTATCVMQPGTATACPSGYPAGPQVFYSGVDDARGCSACLCGAPTGATCTIGSPAIDNCIGGSLNAPNACVAFAGPEPVKFPAAPTLATAGTCASTGGGAPSGTASGTGATSFCCTP